MQQIVDCIRLLLTLEIWEQISIDVFLADLTESNEFSK